MSAGDLILILGLPIALVAGIIRFREWLWERRQQKFNSVKDMMR